MPPFRVEYLCLRQSQYWQGRGMRFDLDTAAGLAEMVKPAAGWARIIDARGWIVGTLMPEGYWEWN